MNRSWVIIGVLIVAWIVCGFFLDRTQFGPDLYNVSIVALPAAALLFSLEYTVMGFRGSAKWWTNDLGTTIVMKDVAIITSNIVLAWAQLFNHGLIDTPLPAWIYVGGVTGAVLILVWRILVWLRVYRQERISGRQPDGGA